MEALEAIKQTRIVPVVTFHKPESILPTFGAMLSGKLPVAEITFRTEFAAEAIKLGAMTFPDMAVGAGTVTRASQAEAAIECGAKFIVSPGYSEQVHDICIGADVPYIPGCVTPTEIMNVLDHGIELIKFFPSEQYGGLKTIKALSAAFPQVTFMPTGGINESNLIEYLFNPRVIACGGSFMMSGSYDDIAAKCANAVALVNSLK